MQYKLQSLFTAAALSIFSLTAQGQTIASFDDLTLPESETSFLQTQTEAGTYAFTTGNATFYGTLSFSEWGRYEALFNYSNINNTEDSTYGNMWAAVTGVGVNNSDNYGIVFAETEPDNFSRSPENGPKLSGTSGSLLAGVYITNSLWAYNWIENNYQENDWYKITIRGYRNNVRTADSIVVTLAEGPDNVVNTWQWVNLQSLGEVDSITFQASTSNTLTPFYYAIDNLTTLDGSCPYVQNIAAVSINENSATINWTNIIPDYEAEYEFAWDGSATLEPVATPVSINDNTYEIIDLTPSTTYYVHIRTKCDDGSFSAWDTASFQTLAPNSIDAVDNDKAVVSISPNPATTQLQIHSAGKVNAVVYNMQGKELMSVNNTQTVNIAALPSGIYLLHLRDVKGQWNNSIRFIKSN